MKKFHLLLLMLMLGSLTAAAQTITAQGKITYADDGTPVVGALVRIVNTSIVTTTDVDGNYSIYIEDPATRLLIITYVGLQPTTIKVTASGTYDVKMNGDSSSLEEVVVTGYGSPRKVGTIIGSIVKVNSKSLENRPSPSVVDALQGKVPGLQVLTSSGRPGETQSIRLHGVGSLNSGVEPLLILDGIQVDSRAIMSINPNDIESVSVLKDASATSIYGSRAANGVIVYTTKRGQIGDHGIISFSTQYGVSSPANRKLQDRMMNTNQLFDFWGNTGLMSASQINARKQALRDNGILNPEGDFWNTNWSDYVLSNNAPTYQSDISFQGGTKNIAYFISGSQYHEKGIVPGEAFDRYTLRANIDSRLNDWAKVGANISLSYDLSKQNSEWNSNGNQQAGGGVSYMLLPFLSPYDREGNTTDQVPGDTMWNPYYVSDKNPYNITRNGALVNLYLQLEPIQSLKIRTNVGVNHSDQLQEQKRMPSFGGNLGYGKVAMRTDNIDDATITNTIEYTYVPNSNHNFIFLAGQEGISNNQKYHQAETEGQTDDRQMELQDGNPVKKPMSGDSKSVFLSYFFRTDYIFKDKYSFDFSIRTDASSRFPSNHRSATFWALGGMWKLSREDFMKSTKSWLNEVNVKASYGTQGNSDLGGDYKYLGTVGSITNYNDNTAWALSNPENDYLTWETQEKLTIGTNAQIFNKLNVSLEWYNRVTKDMLMDVPLPGTTGTSSHFMNVASMRNRGLDLNLSYNFFSGKEYNLTAYVNFNYNNTKILSLFDDKEYYTIKGTSTTFLVGSSLMYYMPISAGVNPQTGQMEWYLPGDDVNVTTTDRNRVTSEYNAEALRQNTGKNMDAPVKGGFGFSGGWRNIGISADFSFSTGRSLYSADREYSENPYLLYGYNTSSDVLDYWKQPGDITKYPKWEAGVTMKNDTFFLENASFARLKNISVSYLIGEKYLGAKNPIKQVKVYFTGRNLLTITSKDFLGMDPEIDSNIALGKISNTKQIVFGLEIKF